VYAQLPAFGVGVGLGRLGLFPLHAEATILLIATLVEAGQIDEAAVLLDGITDPMLARALAGALTLDAEPHLEPIRERLARLGRQTA
jgi:hypothetical protein